MNHLSLTQTEVRELKELSVNAAVDWLKNHYSAKDNLTVGVGSGTTVSYAFFKLSTFEKLVAVPTSKETEAGLREHDITIKSTEDAERLVFDIDGADEVDQSFNMIKGGGGSHYQEKKIAKKSNLLVIVVDQRKLVDYLGQTFPVPVEILPHAKDDVIESLVAYGNPSLRKDGGELFLTDNNNLILDVSLEKRHTGEEFYDMEDSINKIEGVVENGLFVHRKADIVFVGTQSGVKILKND